MKTFSLQFILFIFPTYIAPMLEQNKNVPMSAMYVSGIQSHCYDIANLGPVEKLSFSIYFF